MVRRWNKRGTEPPSSATSGLPPGDARAGPACGLRERGLACGDRRVARATVTSSATGFDYARQAVPGAGERPRREATTCPTWTSTTSVDIPNDYFHDLSHLVRAGARRLAVPSSPGELAALYREASRGEKLVKALPARVLVTATRWCCVAAALLLVPALLGFQCAVHERAPGRAVPLVLRLRKPERRRSSTSRGRSGRTSASRRDAGRVPPRRFHRARVHRQRRCARRRDEALGGPRVAAWDLGSHQPELRREPGRCRQRAGHAGVVLIGVNLGRFTADPRRRTPQQAVGRELVLKSAFLQQYVVAARTAVTSTRTRSCRASSSYLAELTRRTARCCSTAEPPSRSTRQHRYNLSSIHSDRTSEGADGDACGTRSATRSSSRTWTTTSRCSSSSCSAAGERGVHAVLVELPLNEDIVARPLRR